MTLVPISVGAQTGTVSGLVTGTGGQVLGGALIVVEGTAIQAISTQAGRFLLADVPVGEQRIRAVVIGHTSTTRTVTVRADQTTQVDFVLEVAALLLDEIVVTATGAQRRRELGNSISKLEPATLIEVAPITSFQELLQGRASGVSVLPSNGSVGTGARIRIRGISSATLSGDPLIYVDGIRVSGDSPGFDVSATAYVGGGTPSFFNDLNPEEIQSIEIVKGPSAATLYGTQAANGVISITTKRGVEGPAHWSVYAEQGISMDPSDYPGIYFSQGTDGSGALGGCLPLEQAAGACTIDRLLSRNLLKEPGLSPIGNGHRQQYGLQVSGGAGVRYFVSAEIENETGTLQMPQLSQEALSATRGARIPSDQISPNELTKVNLRANLSADVTERLALAVSTGLIRSKVRLPQTGNNVEGIIGTALFQSADPSDPRSHASALGETFAHLVWRETDRFINSSRVDWTPTDDFSGHATVGLDYAGYTNEDFNAPGQGCVICGQYTQGVRSIESFTNYKYSVDVGGSAVFDLTDRIGSRTAVGTQFNADRLEGVLNTAYVFPPGATTLDAGSTQTSGELTVESRTLGSYVEQQISLDDRLFVTGALRVDKNSAFGKGFKAAVYPKASVSFIWFDRRDDEWVNTLRFRGAYGQSGLQPDPNAAIRFLLPVPSTVLIEGRSTDVPSVTVGGLGNLGLRPERSAEYEVGFDAVGMSGRVDLDVTYYRKRTTDALIERELPGSLGTTHTRFENIGEITNTGFEVGVRARILERDDVDWSLGLVGSTNTNELVTLGEGVAPIRGASVQVPGFPLNGHWARGLDSWGDANGDGVIDFSEVMLSDTAVFLGTSLPTRSLQLSSSLSVLNGLIEVGGLLDYQAGHTSFNGNGIFQCAFFQNCRAINDPDAPLAEQARAVAASMGGFGAFVEDATFIKLREVHIRTNLPEAWAARLGARTASVVLTGRNLFTVTDFTSWDPEISTGDVNFLESGQLRTFLFRVNLGY